MPVGLVCLSRKQVCLAEICKPQRMVGGQDVTFAELGEAHGQTRVHQIACLTIGFGDMNCLAASHTGLNKVTSFSKAPDIEHTGHDGQ
jgi:hypothetical protein